MSANVQGLILKSSEILIKDSEEYLVETWVDETGRVRSITESPAGENADTGDILEPTQSDRIEANLDYLVMLTE